MDFLWLPLQIVSNEYATIWRSVKYKTDYDIDIVVFIIYVVHTIINISKFIVFLLSFYLFNDLFLLSLLVFRYFYMCSVDALTVTFSVFIRTLWYNVIFQLGAYYLLLEFMFYLELTLISSTDRHSVSNVWCQR